MALAVIAGITLNGPTAPVRTPVAQSPPASTDLTFRLVAETEESAQETARRLRQAFDEGLREAAPEASWINGKPPTIVYLESHADTQPSDRMFYTRRDGDAVELDGRKDRLSFSIDTPPCTGHPDCAHPYPLEIWERMREEMLTCDGTEGIPCTESTGPRGERIAVTTHTTDWGYDVPFTGRIVHVELAHGRVLELRGTNEWGANGRPKGELSAAPASQRQPDVVLGQ